MLLKKLCLDEQILMCMWCIERKGVVIEVKCESEYFHVHKFSHLDILLFPCNRLTLHRTLSSHKLWFLFFFLR